MTFLLWCVLGAQAEDAARGRFSDRLAQMEMAVSKLKDATYEFHQREVVKCKQQPEQVMSVKYRRPQDIYMTWVGEENRGQQVLYRKGQNKGKMLADPGPWIPSLWLDPTGNLATRGQRNDISRMGFGALADMFMSDAKLITAAAGRLDPAVQDLGVSSIHGDPARCFEVEFQKEVEPRFYAPKVQICFSEQNDLPVSIKTWSPECGKSMLVEEYSYASVKTNVGLTDLDFDPKNPGYDF